MRKASEISFESVLLKAVPRMKSCWRMLEGYLCALNVQLFPSASQPMDAAAGNITTIAKQNRGTTLQLTVIVGFA